MNNEVIKLFLADEMYNNKRQVSNTIDDVSCLLALKACGNVKDKENCRKNHNFIRNNTKYSIANNLELLNTLTRFYGKIGNIREAIKIFDSKKDSNKSASCYNAMMQAYLENDMNDDVIGLFCSMDKDIIDDVSWLIGLKACCNMTDSKNGKKIHDIILNDKKYTSGNNIEMFNTLITFYGKIGEIVEAVKIFGQTRSQDRSPVSYVVMMQGYLENNMSKDTIKLLFSNAMFDASKEMVNKSIINASCWN